MHTSITSCNRKGYGIGNCDGHEVAIPFTFPGDVVEFERRGRRSGIWRGSTSTILTPSPHRVKAHCPYAGKCGGCPWQMFDYVAQLEQKRLLVTRMLDGIDVPAIPAIRPAVETIYHRNRMDYFIGENAELGLRALGTWWQAVDLTECSMISPTSNKLMSAFREWMNLSGAKPWNPRTHAGLLRYLVIREGKRTNERMVILITSPEELPSRAELIALLKPFTTSILLGVNDSITDTSLAQSYTTLYGTDMLREKLCNLTFSIPPNAFFQTNTPMAEQLIEIVRSLVPDRSNLIVDLYCGVGVFGITLAHRAERVIGVEVEQSAVEIAQANARSNNVLNAEFVLAKSEAWPFPAERIDCLIVDPPRSGLHPRVVERIMMLRPEHIIYVSCGPHALARDLESLLQLYCADYIACLDLFPHTPHVETVVRLKRK
ncbi:MAG: 23S rRNA (uracil(1939)-C(5))-methyltransferase RlmD [Candidatus Uhrbacteria bacterium]